MDLEKIILAARGEEDVGGQWWKQGNQTGDHCKSEGNSSSPVLVNFPFI